MVEPGLDGDGRRPHGLRPEAEFGIPPEERTFSPAEAARRSPDSARRAVETAGLRILRAQSRSALAGLELWRHWMTLATRFGLEFNRAWLRVWAGPFGLGPGAAIRRFEGPADTLVARMWGLPASEFRETADGYRLAVDLGGVSPRDVQVRLEQDALLVCGENRDAAPFERRFHLPPDVDLNAVRAELRDGLLEINAPKGRAGEVGQRRIEVRGD